MEIQKVDAVFRNSEDLVFFFRGVNSLVHNIFSDGSVAINNVCYSLK